ncbi:hypothetical protein A2U01_0099565, partial [Trifolium medium]|nr:hypothetical protein [Trifolium medium]
MLHITRERLGSGCGTEFDDGDGIDRESSIAFRSRTSVGTCITVVVDDTDMFVVVVKLEDQ